MDYYDAVLGLIPLTVGSIAVALLWVGVALPVAVSAGSVVAVGLIGHAMFVRTPVGETVDTDTPPSVGHSRQSETSEYSIPD